MAFFIANPIKWVFLGKGAINLADEQEVKNPSGKVIQKNGARELIGG